MKTTVENLRGSVEKLSPKENVKGTHTVLRGSVRAPEENTKGSLTLGTVFPHCLRIFNSCSDYQNYEVNLPTDCPQKVSTKMFTKSVKGWQMKDI